MSHPDTPLLPPGSERCRGPRCGAVIRWVLTEKTGVSMPLNVDPDPEGNVTLHRNSDPPVARVNGPLELELLNGSDEVRYMPHHATCPDLELFRKSRITKGR